MPVLSDDIQLTAPAPGPVFGSSAQIVGPTGLNTFYYWWVAHYPVGVSVVSSPLLVRGAPTLSATNYVIVTGQALIGATSYDLLRTASPQLPSAAANIAVATGLTSPTFNDQGAALTSYNVAGLAAGAPVSEFINLNNRDFATPTLVVAPFGLAAPSVTLTAGGLTFPNGSTQTTAGQTPLTVPTWRSYTVTLVGANWQITAPDGTVTTVPTAASRTQNIPLANLPANAYVIFAGTAVAAGPVGGTPAAQVDGIGTIANPVSYGFVSLDLHNVGGFIDISTTPGRTAINTPEVLAVQVSTGSTNTINQFTPPCSFIVSVLWGVTN